MRLPNWVFVVGLLGASTLTSFSAQAEQAGGVLNGNTTGNNELLTWARSQVSKARGMLVVQQLDNGAIIASPSTRDPDYYYHWTRDAALVMTAQLTDLLASTPRGSAEPLLGRIGKYLSFSEQTQESPNRSGGTEGWYNLGEPKFYVDGRGFDGDWGRPQSDGPALRAILILKVLEQAEIDQEFSQLISRLGMRPTMDTVLRRDLEYVAMRWRESSFDLWEEVRGAHFYNRLVQYRALAKGQAYFRTAEGRSLSTAYGDGARAIAQTLERHWSPERGYLLTTLDRDGGVDYKAANLDAAIVLAALHAADSKDAFFGPSDDKVLATATKLADTFAALYPINRNTRDPSGQEMLPGIGRYPEDRYDGVGFSGGHPWFITTLALAELNYRVASELEKSSKWILNEKHLAFFARHAPRSMAALSKGATVSGQSAIAKKLASELRAHGDQYLARVRYHTARDGAMSEQFNRYDGFMRGARDLTWSYAALLTAVAARH